MSTKSREDTESEASQSESVPQQANSPDSASELEVKTLLATIKARSVLAPADQESQKQLKSIVLGTASDKLKREAISGIASLKLLGLLRGEAADYKEAIDHQHSRILAGRQASALSESKRQQLIKEQSPEQNLSVALLCKDKDIGALALGNIERLEHLTDLCLFATAVHVRKAAATKLVEANDQKLNKELLQKLRGKDKTLTKIFETAMQESGRVDSIESEAAEVARSKQAEAPEVAEEAVTIDGAKAVASVSPSPGKTTKTRKKAKPKKKAAPPPPLTELLGAIEKLSPKNSAAIERNGTHLEHYVTAASDSDAEIVAKCQAIYTPLVEANTAYQKETSTRVEDLYRNLADLLEQGQSQNALRLWDKILGGINNTTGKIQARLQSMGGVYKAQLKELQDWKNFADTEKKKELITRIEALVGSTENPGGIAKQIRSMHEEWKQLGRTSHNESLWQQFKTFSDQAYAPCKDYFKSRKKLMAENLTKRKDLCASLEADLALVESGEISTSKLGTLINSAEESWKAHAPVEQGKIKPIQKRFYASINKLRNLRKDIGKKNASAKLDLVKQAEALVELEDHRQAMDKAKALQQNWKQIGPSSFKEDKKYWADFRAACDAIFEKRNRLKDKLQAELRELESALADTLKSLASLEKCTEEELRGQRSHYKELQQQFSANLDPRLKQQRGKLLERFNASKRILDARYRQLPDKRELLERDAVAARVAYCERLEAAHPLPQEQKEDHRREWQALDSIADQSLAELLDARFKKILSVSDGSEFTAMQNEAIEKIRQTCVEAEILSGVETPEEDQSLRMQYQLAQLKKGFGQAKPNTQEKVKQLKKLKLRIQALGPKTKETTTEAEKRLDLAIGRVG